MNRIHSALIILLLLAGFAVFGHISVERTTDNLMLQLDQLQQSAENLDFTRAQQQAKNLVLYCDKRETLMALFVKRDLINSLRVSLSGLDAYLAADHLPELKIELERGRAQVTALHNQFFAVA